MKDVLPLAEMLFSSHAFQLTVITLAALAVAGYALHVVKKALERRSKL